MVEKEFEQKRTTSINMDKSYLDELDQIRWREHKSMGAIIRKAISEFIMNHRAGNNTFKLDDWNTDPTFQAVPSYFSNMDIWSQYYKDSNETDRTQMRIRAIELQKRFRNIDFNEERR